MAGATIAYIYPVAGAVAPTALQSLGCNSVVASAAYAAGDADATDIVHNLNLSPADGTLGIPEVSVIATAQGSALTVPKIAFKDKDTITVTKAISGANTDVTWRFTIRRPHTLTK